MSDKRVRKQVVDFVHERDFMPLVTVTREVLDNAIQRDSSHCVIADAIKKRLPKAVRVSVDLQTIRFSIGQRRFVYLTPRSAQQLLVDFDQGKKIRQMSFRLQNAQILHATPVNAIEREKKRAEKKAGFVVNQGRASARAKQGRKPSLRKTGGKAPPRLPMQRRTYGVKALVG